MLLILLFSLAFSLSGDAAGAEDIIQLEFGSVRGNLNKDACEFLGVPFATAKRFEAPEQWSQPYKHGVLDATSFSAQCPQLYPSGYPESEDCLSLNIFTPRQRGQDALLPVLVWIHGGGLLTGSAMDPLFNGTAQVSHQAQIVVAINYRLGVLGFAAFNSSSIAGSNNGFRDQVEALNWVRRHIAAFGGDPERVTIYGESAGGQGVAALLTSPLLVGKGLFRAAIAESAGETNTVLLAERTTHTAAILSYTACDPDDLECLQSLSSMELVRTINSHIDADEGNHWAAATVGDDFSPDTALRQVKAGVFSRVPFMLGNNADEGSLFINATSLTSTEAECAYEALGDASEATAEALKGLYPIIPGQNNLGALIDLYSDVAMHCPHRELAQALDDAGASPWVYSFNRSPGCPLQPKLGASHGFEVPFVFQQLDVLLNPLQPNCEPPPEDEDLAKQMGVLWAFFAREGRQVASWPRFEAQTKGPVAKLDLGLDPLDVDTETGYRRGYCARLVPLGIPAFGQTSIQLNAAVERCKGAS